MSEYTLIHNPRCSKSRQALTLLESVGIEPIVVLYLKDTLDKAQLTKIIAQLGIEPRALLRKNEADYKENNLKDSNLTNDAIIDYMVHYPKLIERPILIKGKKAIIGRPPEAIMSLVKS